MNRNNHRLAGPLALGIGLGALILSTGCANSPRWGSWSERPSPKQIEAALGKRPETFIYFSSYEIYREPRHKQYVYQDAGTWVQRDRPPAAVLESALLASPSVRVKLTDTPERRHEAVKREHPGERVNAPVLVSATARP